MSPEPFDTMSANGSFCEGEQHDNLCVPVPNGINPGGASNSHSLKRKFDAIKFDTIEPARPTPARKQRPGYIDANPSKNDGETTQAKFRRAAKAMMTRYNYDDCPLPKDHIRLLFLKPDPDPEADIIVELQSFPMESLAKNPDNQRYTALSYNWGSGDETKNVLVDMSKQKDKWEVPETSSLKDVQFADVVNQISRRMRRLCIRPNLHAFLQGFRDPKREVAIWVDRICIDQKNNEEKQHQVSRMNAIYSMAANVAIWLGPAAEDGSTDQAMDFVGTLLEDGDIPSKLKERYAKEWFDLLGLMRRRWFSRRWIIQELALAKSAEVRCGSKRRAWRDFADAVSIFALHFDTIRGIIKKRPDLDKMLLEGIGDLQPLGARILVDVLANTFQKNADGTIYAPRQGLESLISSLSTFGTSDPRDTVYTLLNLAKETFQLPYRDANGQVTFGLSEKRQKKLEQNPPPVPDYSLDLLEVYTNFVKWCIQESGSLDIICRHWALPELKQTLDEFYPRIVKLPSWIKTVRDSAYGSPEEGFGGRKTGDSFVGTPEKRYYNASFGMKPQVIFGRDENREAQRKVDLTRSATLPARAPQRQTEKKRNRLRAKRPAFDPRSCLTVKGRYLGRVDKVHQMDEGVIPKRVLVNLGHDASVSEIQAVSDAVWRTLVADRGPDGGMPPAWYHRACMTCLVAETSAGNMVTNAILRHDETAPLQADYIKRVQAVCWNRCFIDCVDESEPNMDVLDESGTDNSSEIGVEKRLKGIAPGDTTENDWVCVLYGCSVPVILRPFWSGSRNEENGDPSHYELIGEAFVLGQMDGQAVADLSSEEIEKLSVDFRLM